MNLRIFICCVLAAGVTIFASADVLPLQLGQMVSRGLDYFARQQQPDGSFSSLDDSTPRGQATACCVLALLAAGQTPSDGRHALVVHDALGYLLRESSPDGYFGQAEGSGMTGQDWITLALVEAYGMEGDPSQRSQNAALLRAALAAILSMQDRRMVDGGGGWNAQGRGPGDLATTTLTVLALDALRQAGFTIPEDSLRLAAAFARAHQIKGHALFADTDQQPTAPATSRAMSILVLTHDAKAAEIRESMQYLGEHPPAPESADFQAMVFQTTLLKVWTGEPAQDALWKIAFDRLHHSQSDDGSWAAAANDDPSANNSATTSQAILTLTIPYRLLPLYRKVAP